MLAWYAQAKLVHVAAVLASVGLFVVRHASVAIDTVLLAAALHVGQAAATT